MTQILHSEDELSDATYVEKMHKTNITGPILKFKVCFMVFQNM